MASAGARQPPPTAPPRRPITATFRTRQSPTQPRTAPSFEATRRDPGSRAQHSSLEERSSGTTSYPLANVRGDVTALLDGTAAISSQQIYDPWGGQLSGPAQRYGFLGTYERPSDPSSGLVGMGRRQYDPGNGGFTSEDPVIATLGFGVTANRFEYAADDPQNRTDLHGRNVCDPVHVGPVNVNPINTACEFADDPVGAACRAVTPIPTPFEDPVCEGASAVAGDAAGAAGDTASRVWGYIYKKALSLLSPPCAAAFKPIPATITRVLFGELPPCPPIEDGDPHSPEPPDETPVLPLPPPGSSPIGRPIFEPVPVYP